MPVEFDNEPMESVVAYLGLGSNRGDRAEVLMSAVKQISEVSGVSVRRISQFVETEPVGGPSDQPKYYNAVAEIETDLPPDELLVRLQKIERDLGRRREAEVRWGPRTCDLDILLMGDVIVRGPELTIPHPRMHERVFVLGPLASIAPDVVHPVLRKTIRALLQEAEAAR